jgi:hypothetical protein
MKIALCISGHARTFKECAKNEHVQALINNPDIDIYVALWEFQWPNEGCWPIHLKLRKQIIDTNKIVDIEELKDVYKTENIRLYNHKSFHSHEYDNFNRRNFGGYENNISMFYLIDECFKWANESKKYDILIRLRPDVIFKSFLEIKNENCFTGDKGEIVGAYTDFLFYGKPDDMLKISNYWKYRQENIPTINIPNWHEKLLTKYVNDLNIDCKINTEIEIIPVR